MILIYGLAENFKRTTILSQIPFFRPLTSIAVSLIVALCSASTGADEVNVYSARHYDTDMAMYDQFTERTGIKVNLIEGGSDALIERIVNEGRFSPADMLITVDAGRLWRADQKGIFRPTDSEVLYTRIPAHLRHAKGHWFGLSKRARVIVYNKAEGLPQGFSRYEDLAEQSVNGRVCMRSSGNIYNLSLLGSIIESIGEDTAERWARGVVTNFSRKPQGNDTAQLRAVASAECGVTIANTYYLGRLLGSGKASDKAITDNLGVLFPNQEDRGAHVNISGAGVTRYAPNAANAVQFLEYLTSDFAQRLFAEGNNEYHVVGDVSGPIAQLGAFKEDEVNANTFGVRQAEAVKVFDRAGWR
ncbi:MAG: Fe(3+) ABC transporter substrate-binding protein [Gammaproteobacteria bacterium]|nr:Fe(3+) ABC transporter substrate-binding protein [Gammaproteobacteria bacterium]